MPFIETEASVRYEVIDGKRVPIITPKTEVTLTNTVTGQEYMSDADALADVQNPNTETKSEIRLFGLNPDHFRDVNGYSFRIKFDGGKGYGYKKVNFLNPRSRDFIKALLELKD